MIRKKFLQNKKVDVIPSLLIVMELMIIPIPTSLPRSSSIDQTISDQSINAQDYGYLIESKRARGSDVGIGIIISSMTISKLGITSTLHGLFILKKFFAYHLYIIIVTLDP